MSVGAGWFSEQGGYGAVQGEQKMDVSANLKGVDQPQGRADQPQGRADQPQGRAQGRADQPQGNAIIQDNRDRHGAGAERGSSNSNVVAPSPKQDERSDLEKELVAKQAVASKELKRQQDRLKSARVNYKSHQGKAGGNPETVTQMADSGIRLLHRSFSFMGLAGGNMYTSDDSRVVHVVVSSDRGSFSALLTLVNSIIRNTKFHNITFHFVTPPEDRMVLK